MTQILFYATKEDLLPILAFAEASQPLKYARTGRYLRPKPEMFVRGTSIPELGTANDDASIACASYLILGQSSDVEFRKLPQKDGSTSYIVDQLINPDSVVITAGGFRTPGVLLHGRVGTASDSPQSQELTKLFASAFRKRFRKIKAFWVGNDALGRIGAARPARSRDLGHAAVPRVCAELCVLRLGDLQPPVACGTSGARQRQQNPLRPALPGQGGSIDIGLCLRLGVGVSLMSIPGNAGQCEDPCKCGDFCK